ncbi:MAG: Trm112 family protein [Deltaproteobacteria bacterium]|nr:Trm112 family protein [Deltaproteobacteria bacterium]
MAVPEKLLAILICPQCRGKVVAGSQGSFLICRPCGIAYPVRDGIPRMVVSEAVPVESFLSGPEK